VLEAGGAALDWLLLELLLLELPGGMQGWMATVSVSVLFGITSWFEPGGGLVLPDWATLASEHGGTTIVSGLCCFGMTTVRTPGFIKAMETASWLELEELLELLPQAMSEVATATLVTTPAPTRIAGDLSLLMLPPRRATAGAEPARLPSFSGLAPYPVEALGKRRRRRQVQNR
jgi:hypothetical protein